MTELPYTEGNVELIQEFIDESRKRIADGQDITFTSGASRQLEELEENYEITASDIEYAILNLTVENYYRGVDPSDRIGDFRVCAFRAFVGKAQIEIYLKYGLQEEGLEILIFSNHKPEYDMTQPFKK